MVDLGSPTFVPEFFLRMKMKVMNFHIAVCITLLLENYDFRTSTSQLVQLSAQGEISYTFL